MSTMRETARQGLEGAPAPGVIRTALGPVEYAEEGEGPAVLAVHGAMGGWDQSVLLARTIGAPGFRYLAVSRPGYLGTPATSGRSAAEQGDLLAALLDALELRGAIVMAVSGGGPSALSFALRHPKRCRGLVLVSTCGERIRERPPLPYYAMGLMVRWPGFVARMRKRLEADPGGMAGRSIKDPEERARTLADPEAGPLLRSLTASVWDRPAQRWPGTTNDVAVTRSTDFPLESIQAPALVVHGTADEVVPYEPHARTLTSRIPRSELLSLEGGGHEAIFTHRALVLSSVAGFMRSSLTETP